MRRPCITLLGCLFAAEIAIAQPPGLDDPLTRNTSSGEFPVKYAIYSPAWAVRSNAGLRIMSHNQGDETITLHSMVFRDNTGQGNDIELEIDLEVPAGDWAEAETPFIDLLSGNNCVNQTLQESWRLMEISNYTLNPSVRGLIIENTDSFRIFQCVRDVKVSWSDHEGIPQDEEFWVMYHFERVNPD